MAVAEQIQRANLVAAPADVVVAASQAAKKQPNAQNRAGSSLCDGGTADRGAADLCWVLVDDVHEPDRGTLPNSDRARLVNRRIGNHLDAAFWGSSVVDRGDHLVASQTVLK
jgi:hypothetical protein